MINQDKRIPSAPIMVAPDPFVDLGIPADENVRTIAPISPSDNIPKNTCSELSEVFDPTMNRLLE